MSVAEQFKAAVTSASGPGQGCRGSLERSHARKVSVGGHYTYATAMYTLRRIDAKPS
jgi:hypothetical protein